MNYIEIGVNLFCRSYPDPTAVLNHAKENGVACILTGSDMSENRKIDTFLKTNDAYGTAGIHPHNADSATARDMAEIEAILTHNPKMVAVGECGLDFNRMFSSEENQIHCLNMHIDLAESLKMPMFLHERDASRTMVRIFQKHDCTRFVIHCFTGTREELKCYLDMGFMIGITGWICDDRRANSLRDAVRILPLDRLMIETDAPYLTPRNVPGLARTNVPENIRYVARDLATFMEIPEEEVRQHAYQNTCHFFGLGSV